jgi:hypothetical protein
VAREAGPLADPAISRPHCRVHRPHGWREIQTAREVETAGADHLVELTADLAHTVLLMLNG